MTLFTGIRPRKQIQPKSISEGGTGAPTRVEAVKNLGVPSLDGDNVFTGSNTFPSVDTPSIVSDVDLSVTTVDVVTFHGGSGDVILDTTVPGTLQVVSGAFRMPYRAKTGTYAIQVSDGVVNCTSGTFTATLPTAVGSEGLLIVVKNSGAGVITVACSGGQTIDGAATVVLAAGVVTRVVSDGANWIAV